VGDLSNDTAVEPRGEGRYSAQLSRDWEIWGPMGGYMAAVALRAAGASSPFARPVSFFCHYLNVADFDRIDLEVTTLRSGRTAMAQRVSVTQANRPILEANVWSVGSPEGLEHDVSSPPQVPGPDELRSTEEFDPDRPSRFPFWENVEMRPVQYQAEWPPAGPLPPEWRAWCRFRPTPTFSDPWLDSCRSLILIDVQSWPANSRHHAWKEPHGFIAPSLDLYVAFHRPVSQESWLLVDGHAPVSEQGVFGWTGRIWALGKGLAASGAGQALYRRVHS
jgi:acyl-CoA thioesterase-2